MKTIKKAPTKKSKKAPAKSAVQRTANKRVPLVSQKRPIIRKLKLVEHKHTGKIIHHKNTSHVSLIIILLIIGLFLYANSDFVRAITKNGSVSVGLTVNAPAPTIGATINLPTNGQKIIDQNIVNIAGVCQPNSFVVIRSGTLTIGSTNCTGAGVFSLTAQLEYGENVLKAMNYDNINQAGPITPLVNVSVLKSGTTIPKDDVVVATPITPENPSIITGASTTGNSDCNNYKINNLPSSDEPHIEIVCMQRLLLPKVEQSIGIIAWGGTPPYAISIDLGDNSNPVLISMAAPGYKTVSINYVVPSTYKVMIRLKDHEEKESLVETAIQVSGVTETSGGSAIIENIIDSGWLETPVPFYLLAVAITLGFWGGDIFDRRFGEGKLTQKRRTI